MNVRDPFMEKRRRYLARRRKRYAANQLAHLNDMRARRGKPPYSSVDEIGSDLIRTASERARNERGWFV